MHVAHITPVWPTSRRPERGAFIASLALEFSRRCQVSVVAPRSILRASIDRALISVERRGPEFPFEIQEPFYLGMSNRFALLKRWSSHLQQAAFRGAVRRALSRLSSKPSLVYASFTESGLAAWEWCRENSVPFFVEFQESSLLGAIARCRHDRFLRMVDAAERVISVGQESRRILAQIPSRRTGGGEYIPNGVDRERFRPADKRLSRERLGLPDGVRIAVFTGHFIDRKGPLRLMKALDGLEGFFGIFLGQGSQTPSGPRVLHAGPVPNESLPVWLSAADVFALPSLAEGMANATLEALSVGLPVVVSDRAFNRDFLTEDCAVFVDPDCPSDIGRGLEEAFGRRIALGQGAMAVAARHSLRSRVDKILAT